MRPEGQRHQSVVPAWRQEVGIGVPKKPQNLGKGTKVFAPVASEEAFNAGSGKASEMDDFRLPRNLENEALA